MFERKRAESAAQAHNNQITASAFNNASGPCWAAIMPRSTGPMTLPTAPREAFSVFACVASRDVPATSSKDVSIRACSAALAPPMRKTRPKIMAACEARDARKMAAEHARLRSAIPVGPGDILTNQGVSKITPRMCKGASQRSCSLGKPVICITASGISTIHVA